MRKFMCHYNNSIRGILREVRASTRYPRVTLADDYLIIKPLWPSSLREGSSVKVMPFHFTRNSANSL